MKKFFNWVIVLTACAGLVYCVGLIVPRSLTLGCKTNMATKPDRLYAVVSDVSTWSEWHPDVRSAQERPKHGDNPVWRITESSGASYDLEVNSAEEAAVFQVTYTIDDSRYTLRFGFSWFGQGGRMLVKRTVDTRDPWMRAKSFLWSRNETAPLGLVNALAEHLGEVVKVDED